MPITKTCAVSGQEFTITDEDLAFYENIDVPTPTLCPQERMRRRLAYRNESSLHRRKCDGTGAEIISMYSAEQPFPVYENDHWWGDTWSAKDYGRDFDFTRPFFDQFFDLFATSPKMARIQQGHNQNSRFTNCASYNKNCYFIFSANQNEDCMYNNFLTESKDCVDNKVMVRCELCYESTDCGDCYNCNFCIDADHCVDCWFTKGCIGCKDCFGCVNLRNKQYYFLNEPCTKDEYKAKVAALELHKYSNLKDMQARFMEFLETQPHRFMQGLQIENCSGEVVYQSKNVKESFNCEFLEDCSYCNDFYVAKTCYDVSHFGCTQANELLYECEGCGHGVFEVKFSKLCTGGCERLEYCYECFKSKDCFGCTGLRDAQYCILNKQYTEQEYHALREKIVEHMKETKEYGEFFPIKQSCFGYNETLAHDYWPLTKEECATKGYKWIDKKIPTVTNSDYVIPDSIYDVQDDILDQKLTCAETGAVYRIEPAELKFYREKGLPVPRLCYEARRLARLQNVQPRQLWDRQCSDCNTDIRTSYAPDRPERVLCEDCYLKVVE